jgi:hypothetical protein
MGVGVQCHTPATYLWKETRNPLYVRMSEFQSRFGRVQRISRLPGFDPGSVEPIASRYTDCSIPAHNDYKQRSHLPVKRKHGEQTLVSSWIRLRNWLKKRQATHVECELNSFFVQIPAAESRTVPSYVLSNCSSITSLLRGDSYVCAPFCSSADTGRAHRAAPSTEAHADQ